MFEELLREYRQRFTRGGLFSLAQGERIGQRIQKASVPEEPGVYVIYGVKPETRSLLYIGKGGTLQREGTFKQQKLRGRLKATRGKESANKFYQREMEERGLERLDFEWFVLCGDDSKLIPAKAEIDLLQAYFNDHGQLPPLNKGI